MVFPRAPKYCTLCADGARRGWGSYKLYVLSSAGGLMSAVLLGEGADLEITLVEFLVCGGVLRVGGVLLGEA